MSELDKIIQQSLEDTVSKPLSNIQGGSNVLRYLVRAGLWLYPWWSPSRDIQLRHFWKKSDHIAGAVYTMEAKMSAIPMRIVARDESIREYVREADQATEALIAGAQFGDGWATFYEKWTEDLLTQDNGAFAEIIGAGRPDGPIVGKPVTVRHLDSAKCQRTGHPVYPVLYTAADGKMYKLHYTRVIHKSQMSSTIEEMYGVGFCAVSRAVNIAQNLIDILIYKQEKLGSRPNRAIMVTKGGLAPENIADAFEIVDSQMDSQNLSRYSAIAVVGEAGLPEAGLEMVDLAKLPEGFDERTAIELGMASVAVAFGMDVRELFPALQTGATRADALIQHLKQRGKGPGQIIQITETLFNAKYLPPRLQMIFDFQDDEEDRQAAETKEVRARRWGTAIKSTALDNHTARRQMLEVGDLSRSQFERLELEEGRLPDGTTVLALFFSENIVISSMLDLGLGKRFNPLDIEGNSYESVLPAVKKKKIDVLSIIVNSNKPAEREAARMALAALNALEKQYKDMQLNAQFGQDIETENEPEPQGGSRADRQDGLTVPDERRRKVDLARPKPPRMETDELEADRDEERLKEESGLVPAPFR